MDNSKPSIAFRGNVRKELTPAEVQGAIAWREGLVYAVIVPPWREEDKWFSGKRPWGVRVVKDAQAAFEAIQAIRDLAPEAPIPAREQPLPLTELMPMLERVRRGLAGYEDGALDLETMLTRRVSIRLAIDGFLEGSLYLKKLGTPGRGGTRPLPLTELMPMLERVRRGLAKYEGGKVEPETRLTEEVTVGQVIDAVRQVYRYLRKQSKSSWH